MSKIIFTIVLEENGSKPRKNQPRATKVIRSKKAYTRKTKHKYKEGF